MKKLLKIGTYSVGGVAVFFTAFTTFAALSGVPMHEVKILGAFVDPPSEEGGQSSTSPVTGPEQPTTLRKTAEDLLDANVNVLDSFLIEAPFTSDELGQLQAELKNRVRELKQLQLRQDQKAKELDEQEETLDLRYSELMNLRAALESFETDLHASAEELERDREAQVERERTGWKKLAKTFEDGDPALLSQRLVMYEPMDAARILHALDDERASELITLIEPLKYREYADAYRTLDQNQ